MTLDFFGKENNLYCPNCIVDDKFKLKNKDKRIGISEQNKKINRSRCGDVFIILICSALRALCESATEARVALLAFTSQNKNFRIKIQMGFKAFIKALRPKILTVLESANKSTSNERIKKN